VGPEVEQEMTGYTKKNEWEKMQPEQDKHMYISLHFAAMQFHINSHPTLLTIETMGSAVIGSLP